MALQSVNIEMHQLNSRRNRPDYTCQARGMDLLVSGVVEALSNARKRGYSETQFRECAANVRCLLSDLLAASETSRDVWIGYSRGKSNFVEGGSYWDSGHHRPALSPTYFLSCINFLASIGWIDDRKGKKGFAHFSSRMKATDLLVDRFRAFGLNWTNVLSRDDASALIVKDKNKRVVAWPAPGTFDLDRAARNLRRINDNLKASFLNLCISDKELAEVNASRKGNTLLENAGEEVEEQEEEEEPSRLPIDFSWRSLKRVFAMSSFTLGGRFYGGWWQGVPSRYRKFIEIDGAVTVELDYSTIQPRILYASVGLEPPEDSYVLPNWGNDLRPLVKERLNNLRLAA